MMDVLITCIIGYLYWIHDILVKDTLVMDISVTEHFGN